MRKMKYIIGILLLFMVIGFATVTVSLSITGNAKILSNVDDFKVYFSDVKLNGIQDLSMVNSETELTFDLTFSSLGVEQVISYDVTNASKMFDASLTISCTQGDESLSIINDFDATNLEALSTRTGTLTMKKLKSNANEEDTNYSVICTLDAEPVERTSEVTGEVDGPLEKLIALSETSVQIGNVLTSSWSSYSIDGGQISSNSSSPAATLLTQNLITPQITPLLEIQVGNDAYSSDIRIKNNTCTSQNNLNEGVYYIPEDGTGFISDNEVYFCKDVVSELVFTSASLETNGNFIIPTDQSTTEKLNSADYLGSVEKLTISNPINFYMNHLLSKVTFHITGFGTEYSADAEIYDVIIYSLNSSVTYDGNISGDAKLTEITPYDNGSGEYIAIISPGEYDSDQVIMKVIISDNGELYEHKLLAGDLSESSRKIESGISYNFTLKVGKDIVEGI